MEGPADISYEGPAVDAPLADDPELIRDREGPCVRARGLGDEAVVRCHRGIPLVVRSVAVPTHPPEEPHGALRDRVPRVRDLRADEVPSVTLGW